MMPLQYDYHNTLILITNDVYEKFPHHSEASSKVLSNHWWLRHNPILTIYLLFNNKTIR